jgi:hypothetical protein
MAEFEIIDRHGRRRGRLSDKLEDASMDAATHQRMNAMRAPTVVVDALGFPAGFRPGFCLRKIDLHNASALHVDHNPTPSLEKLRALADAAYEDRKQRMANAWRRPA